MRICKYYIIFLLFFPPTWCLGQSINKDDSSFSISRLPQNYASQISTKIEKYRNRITSKTAKVLTKLSRWENKIHSLLNKTNPQAAEKLFGNNQTTFSSLLQKIKDGQSVASNYKAQYDGYVDKLSTSFQYLQQQKTEVDSAAVEPLKNANLQMQNLHEDLGETEYVNAFIKERKKQLFTESVQYIGKSKYLTKINKESYYYVATLANYKDLFSDTKKTEATVKEVLNKIPAFQKFMQNNSQLASLFNLPGSNANGNPAQALAGLQTRASVQGLIQQRIAAGGPNAMAQVQKNLQDAQSQLSQLKDKILKGGIPGSGGDIEMPDFKPNEQKSKTLWQRLEYGFNVQFSKNNSFVPSSSDLALTLGYKVNDKCTIGIGMSYKMGLGSLQHIRITSQGIGLRSFMDWKISFLPAFGGAGGGLFITGGYEMNYNSAFKNIDQLKDYNAWQRSALIGLSKKYKISKKLKGNMQLLYDFLAKNHVPVSQPVVFRVGYNF